MSRRMLKLKKTSPNRARNDNAAVPVKMSIADLELLSIGLINDMYIESRNDEHKYAALATQEDMDLF